MKLATEAIQNNRGELREKLEETIQLINFLNSQSREELELKDIE